MNSNSIPLPETSVLLQRLQNFLPQIKEANNKIEEDKKNNTNSIIIDSDILVLESDCEENENSSQGNIDKDIDTGKETKTVMKSNSQDSTNNINSTEKTVEIKLAIGDIDNNILDVLGAPDRDDYGAEGACDVSSQLSDSSDPSKIMNANTEKMSMKEGADIQISLNANAVDMEDEKSPMMFKERSTKKK